MGRLDASYLVTAIKGLAELKLMVPKVVSLLSFDLKALCFVAFLDASQGSVFCGQTGYISDLYQPAERTRKFHALYRVVQSQPELNSLQSVPRS